VKQSQLVRQDAVLVQQYTLYDNMLLTVCCRQMTSVLP